MKHHVLATEALLLASTAFAQLEISVSKRDRHTNGQTANVARGLVTRDDAGLETTLWSGVGYVSGGVYCANITVGTPPQLQIVILDTGSSDLYLDARNSNACESSGPHSCVATSYDSSSSSTYKQLVASPAFNATYGDGSTAIGPYVEDTICIDNTCLSNVEFGLASHVESTVGPAIGLMGIGYSYGEAVSTAKDFYPNIPDVLASSGVINSRLYSLFLNDAEDISGSILFGAIDTDKYTGTLETVDILPDLSTGFVDRFITSITGLKVTKSGKSRTIFSGGEGGIRAYSRNAGSLPVLLDSGSSAWSVPAAVYEGIVKEYPFIDLRSGTTSCKNVNSDDYLTVEFNAQIDIQVPMTNWITPVYNKKTGDTEKTSNGDDLCSIGIVPSEGTGLGFYTCGDTIMRSMYIVYDLDNGQMSLAQAKTGSSSSSNIKAVPAGPGGVGKVANNYGSKVPANTFTIVPSVSATANVQVKTTGKPVGTATGEAAVPTAAQVEADSSSGSGSGNSAAGGARPLGWALWVAAASVVAVVLGAGVVL